MIFHCVQVGMRGGGGLGPRPNDPTQNVEPVIITLVLGV